MACAARTDGFAIIDQETGRQHRMDARGTTDVLFPAPVDRCAAPVRELPRQGSRRWGILARNPLTSALPARGLETAPKPLARHRFCACAGYVKIGLRGVSIGGRHNPRGIRLPERATFRCESFPLGKVPQLSRNLAADGQVPFANPVPPPKLRQLRVAGCARSPGGCASPDGQLASRRGYRPP